VARIFIHVYKLKRLQEKGYRYFLGLSVGVKRVTNNVANVLTRKKRQKKYCVIGW
jgi:hypothetical protein